MLHILDSWSFKIFHSYMLLYKGLYMFFVLLQEDELFIPAMLSASRNTTQFEMMCYENMHSTFKQP